MFLLSVDVLIKATTCFYSLWNFVIIDWYNDTIDTYLHADMLILSLLCQSANVLIGTKHK